MSTMDSVLERVRLVDPIRGIDLHQWGTSAEARRVFDLSRAPAFSTGHVAIGRVGWREARLSSRGRWRQRRPRQVFWAVRPRTRSAPTLLRSIRDCPKIFDSTRTLSMRWRLRARKAAFSTPPT